jgi:SAM-dependent methyltransferase
MMPATIKATMPDKPFAGPAARNTAPILEVLRREFDGVSEVLEIGTGTGQHAVVIAAAMPQLRWQTSDLVDRHAGINAWLQAAPVDNVLPPLELDVRAAPFLAPASFDAVFSANTAHIMSIGAVRSMFALVGDILRGNGVFCLYGPFRVGGTFNTVSNEVFDTDLRAKSPEMGIRDLETLDGFGAGCGLHRQRLYAMPANNYMAVWTRKERP